MDMYIFIATELLVESSLVLVLHVKIIKFKFQVVLMVFNGSQLVQNSLILPINFLSLQRQNNSEITVTPLYLKVFFEFHETSKKINEAQEKM